MGSSASKPDINDNKQLIRKIKIALMGTYGVGKTSIITRYIDKKFSPDYIYTRGKSLCISVRTKMVKMDTLVSN